MLILLIGGTSEIGMALAHEFAKRERADFILAGRSERRLEYNARELVGSEYVKAEVRLVDVEDVSDFKEFWDGLPARPDGVIMAVGLLGDQLLAQSWHTHTRQVFAANLVGPAVLLELAAEEFAARKKGFIIAVSSAAGERGRKSNYAYGAAKAGLTAYLSGLRHRLFGSGVTVLTVIPGFVRTIMTSGMRLPKWLTSSPEEVAQHVYKAWKSGKNVVYTKSIWRPIMFIIRNLPEAIFKRTNL